MKRTVIIMAKVPRAGNVKTRLQPFLSAERCAALAEAFLIDTVEKARNIADSLIIAAAPAAERDYFDGFAAENITVIEQSGADLGARMFNALAAAFGGGAEMCVMIGTDSPTFPPALIETAFEKLQTVGAVVGAANDGGFYLIGLRTANPRIFSGVSWSSELTLAQTAGNIERERLTLHQLESWYDVDTPADFARLTDEFAADEAARLIAPRTFAFVAGGG